MSEYPHPMDINNDLEMNNLNSKISNILFKGTVEGTGPKKRGEIRNGMAFIICNQLPDRIMAVEYNLTKGSLIVGAKVKFFARYQPTGIVGKEYGLQMKEGESNKNLEPTDLPESVFLTEIPKKGPRKKELLNKCLGLIKENGFVVLSSSEQCDTSQFSSFANYVDKESTAEIVTMKQIQGFLGSGMKQPYIHSFIRKNQSRIKLIMNKTLTPIQKKSLNLSLLNSAHKLISNNQSENWVIVADEAGQPRRAFGPEAERSANMIIIAIPPGVELPFLHPDYHSMRRHWKDHRVDALRSLCENDGILLFNFEVSPRTITRFREGVSESVGSDSNINMWHTIYLVLEYISNLVEDDISINIYFERVQDATPGSLLLKEPVSQTRDLLRNRTGWSKLNLSEGGPTILAKGEHGLLAYSDVVGLCFYGSGHDLINVSYKQIDFFEEKLKEKAISSKFETDAINHAVEVIRTSERGRIPFLEAILGLTEFEINEYATKYLKVHAAECINNLTDGEWRTFNSKAQIMMSESSICWRAYEFLMSLHEGGIETLTEHLSGDTLLGALMGFLANANHRADIESAELVRENIIKLIDSNEPISEDGKIRAMNNLCVHYQNQFLFENVKKLCERPLVERAMNVKSIESLKLRGTLMQNNAFLGNIGVALNEWNSLNNDANWKGEDFLRQQIYRVHIMIDNSEYQEAQNILRETAEEFMTYRGNSYTKDIHAVKELISEDIGLFFLSVLLKTITNARMMGLVDDELLEMLRTDDIKRRITRLTLYSKHPIQSIFYWAIRLYYEDEENIAEEICNRFEELCEESDRDALGIMKGCYRLDLASRNLLDFSNAVNYFRTVLQQSTDTANKWLHSCIAEIEDGKCDSVESFLNEGVDCDRLLPLKFNYL